MSVQLLITSEITKLYLISGMLLSCCGVFCDGFMMVKTDRMKSAVISFNSEIQRIAVMNAGGAERLK